MGRAAAGRAGYTVRHAVIASAPCRLGDPDAATAGTEAVGVLYPTDCPVGVEPIDRNIDRCGTPVQVRKLCSHSRTEARKRVPNKPSHTHNRWPRSHGNPCHALRYSKAGRSLELVQPAARAPVLRPHTKLQRQELRHKESHVDVLRHRRPLHEWLHVGSTIEPMSWIGPQPAA